MIGQARVSGAFQGDAQPRVDRDDRAPLARPKHVAAQVDLSAPEVDAIPCQVKDRTHAPGRRQHQQDRLLDARLTVCIQQAPDLVSAGRDLTRTL
ncbi:hypothetical protein [Gemmobacter nectariphilus]|uniref:hypothetical protein n=1 Tax=Gemmobacter nectariphilus TaxID=220343 RepID=UPI0004884482|nr:hypothetical protein [Gemmobacter nectariphilus]